MIRQATLNDLYAIEEVEKASFEGLIAWDRMDLEYQIKRGRMWVSEVFTGYEQPSDMEVVGYVNVRFRYGQGRLESVAVLPSFRKLSHGRDLILHAIAVLGMLGAKCCDLDCSPDLVPLYSKYGFKVCGYSHGHYAGEDMVVMRRVL